VPATIKRSSRLVLFLLVLSCIIGCDRATKKIATDTLSDSPPVSFLGDTVRLQYCQNPGAFMSLGDSLPAHWRFWLLTAATSVVVLGVAFLLITRWRMDLLPFIALSLVLAGGLGNLIDRWLQNGLVTDFLNVGVGPIRTAVFNVADVAICLAVVIFFCWFKKPQRAAA
jgi:signal peptidase II